MTQVEVVYSPEAVASLRSLQVTRPALDLAVSNEMDRFESDPGLTRWRRRAYSGVALRTYGFEVRASNDEVLVLWQQTADSKITVVYIGDVI